MRPPIRDRDPGGETQTSLFDSPAVCPHCHTTRRNLCAHLADIEHGVIRATAPRPKGCLTAPNPATDPFPAGF